MSLPRRRQALLARHPWLPFILPLAVFMAVGGLEPTPDSTGGGVLGLAIEYRLYPWIYGLKILLTAATIAAVWPGYRQFPFRLSALAPIVGLLGGLLWIVLCRLQLEAALLEPLGLGGLLGLGTRSGFNPLVQLADSPLAAWGFLAVRMAGLVVVVALAEEFFLRGFVMRFVIDADWNHVPLGSITTASAVAGTVVPMLMHPGELLAAAAWFSMITWLMVRTRNIWDCVTAHAVTNLVLGIYVLTSGQWQLL